MINALEELITKNYFKLTKGQKKIAEYIIKNPERSSLLVIKDAWEEGGGE